jgi:glucosamine-6-phosphate deaminase
MCESNEFRHGLAKFLPFRDIEACERVRRIRKEQITQHQNVDFHIRVIEDPGEFYMAFALDIVRRIVQARDEGRRFVVILPVGPMPQYPIAARLINELGIDCKHIHTFNMDEYANEDGETAPLSWPGSFQRAMFDNFFGLIDKDLRPPLEQVHFPTREALPGYAEAIDKLGGADVVYGGIGWGGHIAFWEPHLAERYDGDLEAWKRAGPALVELHPMTIMQNALHSFSGDWSWVPPMANTIGPAQVLNARDRSFWLDGSLGGGVSWQRFIARLAAHGPVTPYIPASILQTVPGTYTIMGGVADNVDIHMA